jgi:P-type Cu2+ transporter
VTTSEKNNAIALPIAAGVFEPAFGLVLRPEIAALSMSGSSVIVAVSTLALRRLWLPEPQTTVGGPTRPAGGRELPPPVAEPHGLHEIDSKPVQTDT